MRLGFVILFLFCTTMCRPPQQKGEAIFQGEVRWVTGNQMPGPNRATTEGAPVVREIFIYKPLLQKELPMGSTGLFVNLPGDPVKVVQSNQEGKFMVTLPPGKYSVFTKEDDGYFGGTFDMNGVVSPVVLNSGDNPPYKIIVNYSAAY